MTDNKNVLQSVAAVGLGQRVGQAIRVLQRKITVVNSSNYNIVVAVATDPNSFRIKEFSSKAGSKGIGLKFKKRSPKLLTQVIPITRGKASNISVDSSTVYMTVARVKSNGKYAISRRDRAIDCGATWTATDSSFEVTLGVVDQME